MDHVADQNYIAFTDSYTNIENIVVVVVEWCNFLSFINLYILESHENTDSSVEQYLAIEKFH